MFKESLRNKYVGYWIEKKQYKGLKECNYRMNDS